MPVPKSKPVTTIILKVYIIIIIIIIVVVVVVVVVATFMQGIYNYIPETNHASRVYNFAGILDLQFMLYTVLFSTINVLHLYISYFPK
jgi:flagellar basal body-associated protein FliL